MPKFPRVRYRHQMLAFYCAQFILGRLHSARPLIAMLRTALPALQRALAQTDRRAGAILACAHLDRIVHQCNDFAALWEASHLSSFSHSARNFFCNISSAAASASALSLRNNSRFNCSF